MSISNRIKFENILLIHLFLTNIRNVNLLAEIYRRSRTTIPWKWRKSDVANERETLGCRMMITQERAVSHYKTAIPNDEIEDVHGGGVRPRGLVRPNHETEQSRSISER
jgi:hypothetical protein